MAKNQIKFKQLKMHSTHFQGADSGQIELKDGGVGLAKLADASGTDKLIGRVSGGGGDFEEVVIQQALSSNTDQIPSAAAVKTAIDSKLSGLSWKDSVELSSSVEFNNASWSSPNYEVVNDSDMFSKLMDGEKLHNLKMNDRILLRHQTGGRAPFNGLWKVGVENKGCVMTIAYNTATGADDAAARTALDTKTLTLIINSVTKTYIFDADGSAGATGTPVAGNVNININGLARTAIAGQIKAAIEHENGHNLAGDTNLAKVSEVTDGGLRKVEIMCKYRQKGADTKTKYASNFSDDNYIDNDSENKASSGQGALVDGSFLRLTRPDDFDNDSEIPSAAVFVRRGSTAGDSAWVCTEDGGTLNTSNLSFSQFSGAGGLTAGVGLQKAGVSTSTFDLHYLRDDRKGVTSAVTAQLGNVQGGLISQDAAGAAALMNEKSHMLFLNGVLLKPIAAWGAATDGTDHANHQDKLFDDADDGDATGDYYLFWDGALKARISSVLCVDNDEVSIIAPSMQDDTSA